MPYLGVDAPPLRRMYDLATWHLPAGHGQGHDRHTRVGCRACDRWDVVDLSVWIRSGEGGQLLLGLICRDLVCVCGSHDLVGEIWYRPLDEQMPSGAINFDDELFGAVPA